MARQRRKTEEVEEIVYERCCGMDIHKDDIKACLNIGGKKEVRTYSTMTDDLLAMSKWLKEQDVQMVAMESTGLIGSQYLIYWNVREFRQCW